MQNTVVSTEIYWLALTVAMTGLFWAPYIINRLYEDGILKAVWNPQPDAGPKAQWAQRMMAAHENAVENLVLYAPLVLIIQTLGINNDATAQASTVYFFSRLAHYIVFSFGVPIARVVIFFASFYALVILFINIAKYL